MINIAQLVHDFYWNKDYNCARTTLACLGESFGISIEPQTFHAAIGMHGAGRFRAQCGLVEGSLMFIGIIGYRHAKTDKEIAALCFRFAESFTGRFGSLTCRDLRPGGFQPSDPPHACETLTIAAISLSETFLRQSGFTL